MKNLQFLRLNKFSLDVHSWLLRGITAFIAFVYYDWFDRHLWFWYFSMWEFRNNIIGSLFTIPFIYSYLVHRWRGALIIWLISAVSILPRMIYYSFRPADLVRNLIISLVPLLGVLAFHLQRQWADRQRQVAAERQFYISKMFNAQEDERQRIAQELHDGIMQELVVIANRAQNILSAIDSDNTTEIRSHAEWMRDAILQVSEEIGRLSLDLRPGILDNLGLVPALRWLTDRMNQEGKTISKFIVVGEQRKLGHETEAMVFRMVQEALNNVRQHSNATKVIVTLGFISEHTNITVWDNGRGFVLDQEFGKFASDSRLGLIGMQQRARSLGGTVDIRSEPGKGTLVSIRLLR